MNVEDLIVPETEEPVAVYLNISCANAIHTIGITNSKKLICSHKNVAQEYLSALLFTGGRLGTGWEKFSACVRFLAILDLVRSSSTKIEDVISEWKKYLENNNSTELHF